MAVRTDFKTIILKVRQGRQGLFAPENSAHPCDKFSGINGLGQIIIRSDLKPLNYILDRGSPGQDDDRDASRLILLTKAADYIQTVAIGQAQIHQNEIRDLFT